MKINYHYSIPFNKVGYFEWKKYNAENEELVPPIKLSDVERKHTGDEKMIEFCRYQLNIK